MILCFTNMMRDLQDKTDKTILIAHELDDTSLKDAMKEAEIIVSWAGRLTKAFLSEFPKLNWIQLLSSGYDAADIDTIRERNIILTNARGLYSIPIAEDVFGKLIMLARGYKTYLRNQQSAHWESYKDAIQLYGKIIGILGTGSIGTEIAKRARAFGMRVLGVNTTGRSADFFDEVYSQSQAIKLAKTCDFIVAALPYQKETYHIINQEFINGMKKSAFIINVARGNVIDECALIDALESKSIAGAALDVFSTEPLPPDSPLWRMDHIIISPHTAGAGDQTSQMFQELFLNNLHAYPDRNQMTNVVTW